MKTFELKTRKQYAEWLEVDANEVSIIDTFKHNFKITKINIKSIIRYKRMSIKQTLFLKKGHIKAFFAKIKWAIYENILFKISQKIIIFKLKKRLQKHGYKVSVSNSQRSISKYIWFEKNNYMKVIRVSDHWHESKIRTIYVQDFFKAKINFYK